MFDWLKLGGIWGELELNGVDAEVGNVDKDVCNEKDCCANGFVACDCCGKGLRDGLAADRPIVVGLVMLPKGLAPKPENPAGVVLLMGKPL